MADDGWDGGAGWSLPQLLNSLYKRDIVSVKEPTSGQKIGVVASLLVGASGLAWILSLHARPADVIARLGLMCAVLCASAVFVMSWAAIVAYAAHMQDWEPRTCYLAGALPLILVAGVYFFFGEPPFRMAGPFLISLGSIAGYIARKLAYPELTDEQATALPPPPTLFPK